MITQVVLIVVGGFLLGSIPVGVLISRARGVDLRAVGSGNVGATNVHRALGFRWAMVVFVLDVAKGFAPSLAAHHIFSDHRQEWAIVAGSAAVFGHCYSHFIGFRGGKGIATGLGMLLGSSWISGICAFGVFLALFAVTGIVSLSSLIAVASLILFGLLRREPDAVVLAYAGLWVFVVARHRANIRRIIKGEEPRFFSGKRAGTSERKGKLEPSENREYDSDGPQGPEHPDEPEVPQGDLPA